MTTFYLALSNLEKQTLMKKLIFGLLFLSGLMGYSQSIPQSINYQAVARDNAGSEITNSAITVRFSIGTSAVSNSSYAYQETHNISTNQFGLFNVSIGQGTISTGSGAFSNIPWDTPQYLLVEVDFGSGFEQMGVATPFVSVPYALLAKDVLTKELPQTATTNDVLTWNGTQWVPQTAGSGSETTTTLVDNGDGTFTYTNEIGTPVTFDANIDDADADVTNEIQDLQLSGNTLTITNNGSATPIDLSMYSELPATATTGQVLTWNGTQWVAQNSGTGADNWGSQVAVTDATLSGDGTSGNPLSGFDGDYNNLTNTPTIPTLTSELTNDSGFISSESDGDATNEIQDLSVSGNNLNISGGGTGTTISSTTPSAVGQVLTWDGSTWIAQNPGSGADNWGSQTVVTDATLTGDGTSGNPLSGFDGDYNNLTNTPTIPTLTSELTNDSGFITTESDGDATNEIQDLSISGNNLNISGGGTGTPISSTAPSSAGQVLTWDGSTWVAQNPGSGADNWGTQTVVTDATLTGDGTSGNPLSIVESQSTLTNNGDGTFTYTDETGVMTTFDANIDDADADASNELQDLSISGNTINISGGTGTDITTIPPSTIGEVLTWNGTSWEPATPSLVTNTDDQTLSISTAGTTNTISIEDGNSVSFSIDDADSDPTNEHNTGFAVSGSDLTITDGGGTLSVPLSSLSSADTDWTETGSSVYNDTKNVGIGTSSPNSSTLLHVEGSDAPSVLIRESTPTSGAVLMLESQKQWMLHSNESGDFKVTDNSTSSERIRIDGATGNVGLGVTPGGSGSLVPSGKALSIPTASSYITTDPATIELIGTSATGTDLMGRLAYGYVVNSSSSAYVGGIDMDKIANMMFNTNGVERMRILNNGDIGIGTTSPDSRVHIASTGPSGLTLESASGYDAYLDFHENGSLVSNIFWSSAENRMRIEASGNDIILASGAGNVGIGVGSASPISTLDVNGQITMETGAVAGYIPVSDANGTMTWTDPTTISTSDDGDWTKSGSYLYNTTENIGIGTTTPNYKLHLSDNSNTYAAYINQTNSAGAALGVFTNTTSSSAIVLQANSSANGGLYVKGDGKVGVGVTNPFGQFEVATSDHDRASQIQNSTSSSGNKYGLYANASGDGTGDNNGGWFDAYGAGTGINTGVGGQALGSAGENRGVYGSATGGTANWAGYFDLGDVHILNNVAIGSTAYDYGGFGAQTVSITDPNSQPHFEMNGYGVGTSSPATYMDFYKYDGTNNNFIGRQQFGSYGSHSTGYYLLNLGISGSMTTHISANNGKVGIGPISYSSLNDVLHVYENDGSLDGENGALMVIQNGSGGYSSASSSEMSGIRFKVGSYVPNGMSKGGIFFERYATYGRGDMIFALNNSANLNNVSTSDQVMRLSNDGASDIVSVIGTTSGDAGSFSNQSTGGGTGVRALATTSGSSSGNRYGVYSAGWYGQSLNYGIYSYGYGGTTAYGIYATAGGGSSSSYAGYFSGNVHVNGTLSKSGGTFKIDHPQDPENKYLIHSFIESPDMMNIYNGNITTDANGEAVVSLPGYFEDLNMDFRYQLTVIGSFAGAMIDKKIENNQFVIKTSEPNIEVSWQVTGIRKDAWANENRVIPEVEKTAEEKGKYLNPEVFGQPLEKGIHVSEEELEHQ